MKKTHLFEIICQIQECTDLKILSACYTADSLETIFLDDYDKQKYRFSIKPTNDEKL